MAASDVSLTAALINAVRSAFQDDAASVTVGRVRADAESALGLDGGFFKGHKAWNEKSKDIVKTEFTRLEESTASIAESSPEKPKPKAQPKAKSSTANVKAEAGSKAKAPVKKRKRDSSESDLSDVVPYRSDLTESDAESDAEFSDSEEEQPKQKKPRRSAPTPTTKRQTKAPPQKVSSEEEVTSDSSSPPRTAASRTKPFVKDDSDSESKEPGPNSASKNVDAVADDSDSVMSVLLDEAPKPKKSKANASSSGTKQAKRPRATAPELTPTEQEIRTLKSQLEKCGMKKIWGFELKQFGDDSKAKLRHLKDMLRGVGMTGRFSEARAAEIKEQRELMQDMEAIQADAGDLDVHAPRERRSKAKAVARLTVADVEETDPSEVGYDEPERKKVVAAKQDLAFLGSESESD